MPPRAVLAMQADSVLSSTSSIADPQVGDARTTSESKSAISMNKTKSGKLTRPHHIPCECKEGIHLVKKVWCQLTVT